MAPPHIPDEILVEIFSFLPSQDLARVSLAARRLHCISQPLLYSQPELYARKNGQTSSLQAFLRTLLTTGCQTRASHVRHLTISWRETPIGPDSPDFAPFTIAALRFGLHDWPLTDDIHLMLLFHLLTSLETIHLHPIGSTNLFHYSPPLDSVLQPVNLLPAGLLCLRAFRCDLPCYVRPRTLSSLLALPHLRSLALPICGDIGLVLRGSDIPIPGSSLVTSLEFCYAYMPHAALRSTLAIPHALTHFYYRATPRINLIGFYRALEPLRESLQTLVLDFSWMTVQPTRAREDGEEETGLSLRDWPALRNVAVSLVVLVGIPEGAAELADVLPPGISMLRVLGDHFWTGAEAATALVVLLERKEEVVPRLESVGLWEDLEEDVENKLRGVCATTGVQILGAGADLGRVFARVGG